MVRLNRSRMDYLRQFQAMINDYNSGAGSVETFFANLVAFARGWMPRSSGASPKT